MALIVATVACASCVPGSMKCDTQHCSADAEINEHVQAALYERRDLPMENVTVQTIGSVVYLYGIVDTELQRELIEQTARDTTGVVNVVNSIGVRNSVY